MKKSLIRALVIIIIGFIIGNILFNNRNIFSFKKNKDKYYFLQEGTYYDKSILDNNLTSLKQKVVEYNGDKICIYTGITKSLDVAEKLLNIYDSKNIKLTIKEKYYSNEEFKNNVEQFDLLIESSKDIDEILKIEEVVLANYEEIIKNSENVF